MTFVWTSAILTKWRSLFRLAARIVLLRVHSIGRITAKNRAQVYAIWITRKKTYIFIKAIALKICHECDRHYTNCYNNYKNVLVKTDGSN
ncbi:MAG: hypothetical protein WCP16_20890 [Pseudanabaena sp. ELA645]